MTKDIIAETVVLKALLSETADHQILAEMLGFFADRLMVVFVDLMMDDPGKDLGKPFHPFMA